MSFSDAVWERTGYGTLSKQLYSFLVCGWTAIGVATSAWASSISHDWELNWVILLGVLAVAIAGVFVSTMNDNPVLSFLGYIMITIPFGLMLGPVVALYTEASVFKVFFLTTIVVVSLGFVGATIPDSLDSWAGPLLGGLLLLLGGLFIVPLAGFFGFPVRAAMTVLDWVGLLLFGALVIFDLNRAMRIPYTMDNAIDSAVGIYLDIANIFIRLLSLFGVKVKSD